VEFVDGSAEIFDLIVCATGYEVAYPFLPQALQRVQGQIVQCYGGAFLPDYRGIYYIGWGQVRGGVGSVISAFGPFFTRCLKLQAQVKIPIGLAFKSLGQSLPKTHLSDPHRIFRRLKFAHWLFPLLARTAHRLDDQYPDFTNIPLAEPLANPKHSGRATQ
jgi:hypothetical protein